MTKKITYLLIVSFFAIAIGVIAVSYKMKQAKGELQQYSLQDRRGELAALPEWAVTRNRANELTKALREDPTDSKSALALASLFIQEARVTGNYSYYDVAALKQVEQVLKKDPSNFEAVLFKALIQLSQHHFSDGLVTAQQAQKINPYNAFVHGILIDANVELGNYTEAVQQAEKMISIRPDLSSYSRISYLREIHGDLPGAVEAMKLAVEAGLPGADATEWARVQLGHLYENLGLVKSASLQYQTALDERPGYAPALAGLGHCATASGDYANAVKLYEKADSLVTDYSFKESLADLYRLTNKKAKGDSMANTVVSAMRDAAIAAQNDPTVGHYTDKELAYAYLKIGDAKNALEHALAEYNRRPANIDVNETVAWAQYKRGAFNDALPYISKALSTKCQNPALLCHAGLIYAAAGDKTKGKMLLQEALKNNAAIDADLKTEAQQTLQSL